MKFAEHAAMRPTAHEGAKPPPRVRLGVRLVLYVGLCAVLSLLYLGTSQWGRNGPPITHYLGPSNEINNFVAYDYAIHNADGCRIPDFDPFNPKFRRIFHRVGRPVCSSNPPITRIQDTGSGPEIVINEIVALKRFKANKNFTCCYQEVTRAKSGERDLKVKLTKCQPMKRNTPLSNATEFIIVTCINPPVGKRKPKILYKNAHALIPDKEEVRNRLAKIPSQANSPVSVLMIGIDSISRINLIRAMPRTCRYLHDNDWIELRGYNKIADNTYPNVMAVLTGYNSTDGYSLCKPTTEHGLDRCPIIWRNFSNKGYVTAYGEDYPKISTFDYRKKGFQEQPTDYYLRAFFLGMYEQFHNNKGKTGTYCAGPIPAGQRLYDYAAAFTAKFRDDPFFALFWFNTFSHDEVNLPSTMDIKTQDFFESLQQSGVLDASVIFFFSDHGIRFGMSREIFSGFYEERLPFFFAWFPPWFRDKYPDLVQNFRDNSNRLTNPYDFHMTLRHLLSLSNPTPGVEPGTRGCPKCDSLLKPVSPFRTCEDASIDKHWCTCGELEEHHVDGPLLKHRMCFEPQEMANAAVDHLNNIELFNQSSCSPLKLNRVLTARSLKGKSEFANQHIVFETKPGLAKFEATVSRKNCKEPFIVETEISRLNTYAGQSDCVDKDSLRKYCYCIK